MKYPIALEAYIETMQGNFLECRRVVRNQHEASAFKMRYSNCIIKTTELNSEELKEFQMEMSVNEAIDKVVLFLARPENKENNFPIVDLMTELGIPNTLHTTTAQRLSAKHYIKGGPALRNPIIWIDAKGLAYAEELENKHFEEHGTPISAKRLPALPINEVCEIVFQMHKNHDYKVVWIKETHNNQPANLEAGKDVLIKKGIIYIDQSSRHKVTKLDPDYLEANSYEEANNKLLEAKGMPKTTNTLHIGGSVYGPVFQDAEVGRDLSTTNTPPANPTTAEHNNQKRTLIGRLWDIICNNIIASIFALIVAIIAGYLIFKFGWT